jgi:hypothetical protein
VADDLIPSNDDEFDHFQEHFVTNVVASPAKYGLLTEDATALQAGQTAWSAAYAAHNKARNDAQTAVRTKDVTRGQFETILRSAAQKVNGSFTINDGLRASVGLRPRDVPRSLVGAPTTRPLGRIELRGPSTFVVHFVDEKTPLRRAKPKDAQGCQIWTYVGDTAPADPSGYTFLALDTRTPYTDQHRPSNAGKTVFYLLRWQNAKGEPGPWSDVVMAKIPL